MTTIYRGNIQNVTLDILLFWLKRGWLENLTTAAPLPALLRDTILQFYPDSSGDYYTDDDGATWLLAVEQEQYRARLIMHQAKITENRFGFGGGIGMHVWIHQLHTNAVQVLLYEPDPPRFGDNLRTWLREAYSCHMTHKQLTPKQRDRWDELQEFTVKVEQEGMTIKDAEEQCGVAEGTMRKAWTRLRAEIGIDPPWPRTR